MNSRMRPILVAASLPLGLVLAGAGCQHGADERLGLAERGGAAAVEMASLGRAGEVEKALELSSAEAARRLGSYSRASEAKIVVRCGDRTATFAESWRLEVDDQGSAYVAHRDDKGDGLELYAVGGQVYARPGPGRFVRHAAEGDEVERARDGAERVLASWLAVLGRFAARRDDGPATVAGRPARKVTLSLAGEPAPLADDDPAHAWRKAMKVSALDGELLLDAASGLLLRGSLRASYAAPRADASDDVAVTLDVKSEVETPARAIAAPEGAAPSPSRPRPMLDRQQLLDGLVTTRE